MGYQVAGASEYLAITGFRIDDIKLVKKAWIFPGQSYTRFDVSPVNYTFEVQAMSAEKLPFILPAVFMIGPLVDDPESLMRYACLISPHDKLSNHVKELVQGVIEGETRVLAASMTMEEIFKGTKSFKQEVIEKVQLELNQFGLIYNKFRTSSYTKKKEAKGMTALAEAQGILYIPTLLEALGGNFDALKDYLLITNGTYQQMAKINAEAVQRLNSKISVWTTGGDGSGGRNAAEGNVAMKEIAGIYRMLPPLLDMVKEQTRMIPPTCDGLYGKF